MKPLSSVMFVIVSALIPVNLVLVIQGNNWSIIPLVISVIGFSCFLLAMHEETQSQKLSEVREN